MSSIFKRLYKIGRAYASDFQQGRKTRQTIDDAAFAHDTYDDDGAAAHHKGTEYQAPPESSMPPQLVEDLANFGLIPPSSLEAVRRARNREVKKYHPDFYSGDSEKSETAKQILQILNASFDRLEAYYSGGTE